MINLTEDLRLENRSRLPDDLRFLVEKYPREEWRQHANLGEMAQFWLQRHDMFRELSTLLQSGVGEYREGRLEPAAFARWFGPRLRFFLQQLHGHHQIEDMHYFPLFAKAERRLERGFNILDSDHHVIHEALERNSHKARAFLLALQQDADRQRFAADAYADENAGLIAMLDRHLSDEEDLIIPLILDRGEDTLGVTG
ncbi:hemerythrin domain-containing protein [Chelativorans sp. M5D2P16]|uniref:hemerythrin domain-containing protein n=1 Tax=Chelativorans sp. M5D2P16 TaxID=3095678 RepID=UPI002ACAB32B|nr:hemerythrin domain-containing protein [Chelativorans sp. M5D2P16]MDZ5697764.1 hemerythrin domain-containing protein [Chelativorans sp. M5D2P16]